MAYICNNIDCENYNKLVTPGGKLVFKNDEVVYTGSKCKYCDKEMKHIPNHMGDFKSINNASDGRNM